jgi:hypothetical protein
MLPEQLEELRLLQSVRHLPPGDRTRRAALVSELLAVALQDEHALLDESRRKRRSVRMRRAVPLEIAWGPHVQRALTLDVSPGGLSTLLAVAPPRAVPLSIRLQLSARDTVTAVARVVAAQTRTRGTWRVSLAIVEMADEDRARLEGWLAADALAQASLPSRRAG